MIQSDFFDIQLYLALFNLFTKALHFEFFHHTLNKTDIISLPFPKR